MSLPLDEQPVLSSLRRSGMQSSRYADLDPGRTCLAARTSTAAIPTNRTPATAPPTSRPHLRRLRGGELAAPLQPRRGDARRAAGSALQRVREPHLPGRPDLLRRSGPGFYPGSLVWDQHCIDLRASGLPQHAGHRARRSLAVGTRRRRRRAAPLLPERRARIVRGHHLRRRRHRAEGWSCDPDFPAASNPVQISIGGAPRRPERDARTPRWPTNRWSPDGRRREGRVRRRRPARIPLPLVAGADGQGRLRLRHRHERARRTVLAASRR